MDRVEQYDKVVKDVLTEIYQRYTRASNDVNYQLVMDEDNHNYLLLTDGWIGESRFYGILIHIQVKPDGRVWLHDDNTDLIVVDWLLERGIPSKEIVLGWHAPDMRADTEFAVA